MWELLILRCEQLLMWLTLQRRDVAACLSVPSFCFSFFKQPPYSSNVCLIKSRRYEGEVTEVSVCVSRPVGAVSGGQAAADLKRGSQWRQRAGRGCCPWRRHMCSAPLCLLAFSRCYTITTSNKGPKTTGEQHFELPDLHQFQYFIYKYKVCLLHNLMQWKCDSYNILAQGHM